MDWHGGWKLKQDDRAYFGEYKIGRLGDSVSFSWRGTDLDLVAMQNPYGGAVRVQVDSFDSAGAPLRTSPARDIELWRTDAGAGGRISLARDLDDGTHRVTLTVTRAPVAINGFIVQRGNAWWIRKVGSLLGLFVGSLGGWWMLGRRRARMNADQR
jgi:hypothetical protein